MNNYRRATIYGIDYSLTSPGICEMVIDTITRIPISVTLHGIWSPTKKQEGLKFPIVPPQHEFVESGNFSVIMRQYPDWKKSPQLRYHLLALWAAEIISNRKRSDPPIEAIYIEDYAYAAKGKVFHIAENTGVLKQRIWDNPRIGVNIKTISPGTIKKHATGKGNANKDKMIEQFKALTQIDLQAVLDVTSKAGSGPISDLVDAFYVAKTGLDDPTSCHTL